MGRAVEEIYAGLNDFELIELVYMSKDHLAMLSTILVSFYFGYLAVAHFSGKALSTLQATVLTVLYSLIAFLVLLNMYLEASVGVRAGAAIVNIEPSYVGTYITVALFSVSWLATIMYMYQIRRTGSH